MHKVYRLVYGTAECYHQLAWLVLYWVKKIYLPRHKHKHTHTHTHTLFQDRTYILFKVLLTVKRLICVCRPAFAQQPPEAWRTPVSQPAWAAAPQYRVWWRLVEVQLVFSLCQAATTFSGFAMASLHCSPAAGTGLLNPSWICQKHPEGNKSSDSSPTQKVCVQATC